MNSTEMRTSALLGLFALLCAPTPLPAQAQDAEPGWVNLRVIEVQPGRAAEWEELHKVRNAAFRKAGRTPPGIWEVVRGEVDTYYIVSFVSKLGDNDEPAPDPLGEAGFAQWGGRISQCVGRREVLTLRRLTELSIPAKEGREPNLAIVSYRESIPSKRRDYESYLRDDYIPAMKKAQVDGVFVSRGFAGASPDTYVVASWIDKWSAFDGPHPIAKALGQEEARRIFDKGRSLTARRRTVTLRHRPDLSP